MSTHLWVGSLDHGDSPGLHRFDVADTTLRAIDAVEVTNPAWLVDSPATVWAAQHNADSALVAITDEAAGDPVHTGDADACHAALSPGGDWVAVAHYTSGSVSIFGTAGGVPRLVAHRAFSGNSGHDPARQEAPHAHHVAWLDAQTLLVCDLGADLVRVLTWDESTLTEGDPIVLPAGFGPRHLVLRPTTAGHQLAVAGELDGRVASFETDSSDEGMQGAGSGWRRVDIVDGTLVGGSAPSGIRLVDDNHLVMANRFINTLAFIDWPDDGSLALVDEIDSGGEHARDLVVHEGRIWVAHKDSDDITVFGETSHGWRIIDRTEVKAPAALLFRSAS